MTFETVQEGETIAALEARLQEAEERFKGLFEESPVACHEIDRNGVVQRVNRSECALLGFEPAEMVGRQIWDFMVVEEREKSQEGVRQRISGEQSFEPFEREYTRRDGTHLVLEIHSKLIRNASGEVVGIRSFLLDVTKRKRAEEALREKARDLERSNAELEQFAYVASHDLQEPLRKILAFGDRLKNRYFDVLGAEGQDYLLRMQNASSRMQLLIQDLLQLCRVASHKHPFTAVDLGDVTRNVLSDLESRIEQLQAHVEVGPLPVILADKLQMAQLIQNLLSNALKFHKPGTPPRVKVFASFPGEAAEQTRQCQIAVEDNGIGFEEKYLDRVFQVFQRLHGRNEYEGTGVGLAICRKIAERHGGSITAHSAPGMGAKFVVTLPCIQEKRTND
jgi:PAS domain S-box-containing protein